MSVIDTATNTVIATYAVPVRGYEFQEYPFDNLVTEVAVSPHGERIYVGATDGSLSVIDTVANDVTTYDGHFYDLQLSLDGAACTGLSMGACT